MRQQYSTTVSRQPWFRRLASSLPQCQRALLGLLCGLLIASASAAPDTPAAAPSVQIGAASFGLFDARTPGELSFEASKVVPRREGQRYGWVIEVKTAKRRVSVREEYLLPPKATAAPAPDTLLMDTRRQVSQRELALYDGKIYGEWSVGPGEPPGHRHLQVFVDNVLAGDFEFEMK